MPTTAVALPEAVSLNPDYDWFRIAKLVLISRTMDLVEETELYPQKLIPYQFSARSRACSSLAGGAAHASARRRGGVLSLATAALDAGAHPRRRDGSPAGEVWRVQ